jgi:hypothetical protein
VRGRSGHALAAAAAARFTTISGLPLSLGLSRCGGGEQGRRGDRHQGGFGEERKSCFHGEKPLLVRNSNPPAMAMCQVSA